MNKASFLQYVRSTRGDEIFGKCSAELNSMPEDGDYFNVLNKVTAAHHRASVDFTASLAEHSVRTTFKRKPIAEYTAH